MNPQNMMSAAAAGKSQPNCPPSVDERQLALASLFSSLSSLASSQQQLQVSSNSQPPSNNPITPNGSIQSVMMAAMMQQQLSASVMNPQLHQPPTSFVQPDQVSNLFTQQSCPSQQQIHIQTQQQQQQQLQHQQNRINYCTICNKELCNKYFMKTHMLKMHGINLETEQTIDDSKSDASGDQNTEVGPVEESQEEQYREQVADFSAGKRNWSSDNDDQSDLRQPSKVSKVANSKSDNNQSSNNNKSANQAKQARSVMNGFAGNSMGGVVCDICNKELCSKYFLKVHKQNTHGIMTDYQDPNQFMYPFGGPITAPSPFMSSGSAGPAIIPGRFNPINLFAGAHSEDSSSRKRSSSKRSRQTRQESTSPMSHMLDMDKNSGVGESMMDSSHEKPDTDFESVYRLILAQQQQQQQHHHQTMANSSMLVTPPPPVPMGPMTANPLSALMCFGAMASPFGMSPALIVDNILRNQHLFNRPANKLTGTNITNTSTTNSNKRPTTDRNNNNLASGDSKTAKNAKESATTSRYFNHYTEACPMCDRRFKSIKWLKTHMMNDHKQEIGAYMQMMMQYLYTSKSEQMAATMAAMDHRQQHEQHQQLVQQHHQQQHQHQHQQQQQIHKQIHHEQLQQPLNIHRQPQTNSLLADCNFSPGAFQQHLRNQQHSNETKMQSGLANSRPLISPPRNSWPETHNDSPTDYVIDARCRQESLSPGEPINRQSATSSPLLRPQIVSEDNSSDSDETSATSLLVATQGAGADRKAPNSGQKIHIKTSNT